MKASILNCIVVVAVFQFAACSRQVSQEELIGSAVELKLRQWETTQIETCKDRALQRAENFVDSLLLATSLDSKLDTIPKPGKPIKPTKPEFREKPDTISVRPIYPRKE